MPRSSTPPRTSRQRSRSPKGVDRQRRINTGFMPDERALIEEIARRENRTDAATVRLLVMAGARATYPDLVAKFLKDEDPADPADPPDCPNAAPATTDRRRIDLGPGARRKGLPRFPIRAA